MARDHSFRIAVVVSMIVHFTILVPGPLARSWSLFGKRELAPKEIEVTYRPDISSVKRMMVQDHKATVEEKSTFKKGEAPVKPAPKTAQEPKPAAEKVAVQAESYRDISAEVAQAEARYRTDGVEISEELRNIAQYKDIIKAKVWDALEKEGRTYYKNAMAGVSFDVMPNGNISNLAVLKLSDRQNWNLERIVLKSVRSAAPFPPFPDGLEKTHLTCKYRVLIDRYGKMSRNK